MRWSLRFRVGWCFLPGRKTLGENCVVSTLSCEGYSLARGQVWTRSTVLITFSRETRLYSLRKGARHLSRNSRCSSSLPLRCAHPPWIATLSTRCKRMCRPHLMCLASSPGICHPHAEQRPIRRQVLSHVTG